jgi:beta-1,4-glucosyltransferase
MDAQNILYISKFPVHSTTRQLLVSNMLNVIRENKQRTLFFANTNLIVNCRFILTKLPDPTLVLVNDGIGMDIAAKLMHGRKFTENLNGTDFTPALFREAAEPLRVFMIGGKPEVLAKASRYVQDQLGQQVVGSCDGYDGFRNTTDLVQRINASNAQVVLVAMGNPIQERWILDNRSALNTNVMLGVGALFDFWSGDKPRAPALFRRLRLEWFYRLLLEPRRLVRRYTWDILVFLRACFKHR